MQSFLRQGPPATSEPLKGLKNSRPPLSPTYTTQKMRVHSNCLGAALSTERVNYQNKARDVKPLSLSISNPRTPHPRPKACASPPRNASITGYQKTFNRRDIINHFPSYSIFVFFEGRPFSCLESYTEADVSKLISYKGTVDKKSLHTLLGSPPPPFPLAPSSPPSTSR